MGNTKTQPTKMKLFDKYFKTATFGRTYTQRFRRVLLIVCLIVWGAGLVWIYEPTKNGVTAIFDYFQEKENIKNRKATLDKHELAKKYLYQQNPNDTLTQEMFDIVTNKDKPLPEWLDKEVTKFASQTDDTETDGLQRAKDEMWGLTAIPTYLFLFFILPWLLLRLFFWIKTADNVTKV